MLIKERKVVSREDRNIPAPSGRTYDVRACDRKTQRAATFTFKKKKRMKNSPSHGRKTERKQKAKEKGETKVFLNAHRH